MRKILLSMLFLVTVQTSASEIVPTPDEQRAILLGMRGTFERLSDSGQSGLDQKKGRGCWLDKTTRVRVGTMEYFQGVRSRCVSWNEGARGKKKYIFLPIRLIKECDRVRLKYNECFK